MISKRVSAGYPNRSAKLGAASHTILNITSATAVQAVLNMPAGITCLPDSGTPEIPALLNPLQQPGGQDGSFRGTRSAFPDSGIVSPAWSVLCLAGNALAGM
jgi:hypothetical protein